MSVDGLVLLSDPTAAARETRRMSMPSTPVRGVLGSMAAEFVTGIATAPVALCTIAVCCVAFTAVLLGPYRRSRRELESLTVRLGAVVGVLAILTMQVRARGWLTSADAATTQWFVDHRGGPWTAIAQVVTQIGGPAVIVAVACVAAVVLWYRTGSYTRSVAVLAALTGAIAVSTAGKELIGRARPPAALHLVTETDYSFPSGHVTATAALAFTLLLMIGRRRTVARMMAAALVVGLVAISRVYLGVHWLTDVCAGALLGAVSALLAALVVHAVEARRASASKREYRRPGYRTRAANITTEVIAQPTRVPAATSVSQCTPRYMRVRAMMPIATIAATVTASRRIG